MDYVCLAAGKGTRFGALGRYLQKCMYPVGLTPFVEFSVRNLSRVADPTRDRLLFVVGHHGEQVKGYFGERYRGLELAYTLQPNPLGTAHALHLASERLQPSGPVVVWLADLYVPAVRFREVLEHPEHNVQTLAPGPESESDKVRVLTEGDLVTKAWCGGGERFDIGLWKFSKEVVAGMMKRREGEYRVLPNLQEAIDEGHRVGFVEADEWLHLGGTVPTAEENVRRVVRRVWALEAEGETFETNGL